MGKQYNAPRGTKDILPEESSLRHYIEEEFRRIAETFGYREIRTPTFEEAGLYIRGIGETSDIVNKEMYIFEDRGGRQLALRPEGTAGVVRAYIEHGIFNQRPLSKFYYILSLFRYERPQAGRYREHYQLGVEAFGSKSPYLDAEVIYLAWSFLGRLGVNEKELRLNSVGCPVCRPRYLAKLKEFLEERRSLLCGDCQARLERNPLRVLDCKKEGCREATKDIPLIYDMLCEDCSSHFSQVKDLLSQLGVPFLLDPRLVRGLDYYTKTAFEIVSNRLGAQNSICGGGRYDGLVEELGGPSVPAVGWGMGMERLLLVLEAPHLDDGLDVFVAYEDETLRKDAFFLLMDLRGKGFRGDMDFLGRSLKSQLREANRLKAKFALILRGEDFQRGIFILRDMVKGEQEEVKVTEIGDVLGGKIR